MDDHAGFTTNRPEMVAQENATCSSAADLVVASSGAPRSARARGERERPAPAQRLRRPSTSRWDPARGRPGPSSATTARSPTGSTPTSSPTSPSGGPTGTSSSSARPRRPTRAALEAAERALPGEKPYAEIPSWLARIDVAIIPFKRTAADRGDEPRQGLRVPRRRQAGRLRAAPGARAHGAARAPRRDARRSSSARSRRRSTEDDPAARRAAARLRAREHLGAALRDARAGRRRELFPKVSIVVVTCNNLDLNRLCLESLFARTEWPNLEIIVVDNALDRRHAASYLREARAAIPESARHPERREPRLRRRQQPGARARDGRLPRPAQQRHRRHARLARRRSCATSPRIRSSAWSARSPTPSRTRRGSRSATPASRTCRPGPRAFVARARRRGLRDPDARAVLRRRCRARSTRRSGRSTSASASACSRTTTTTAACARRAGRSAARATPSSTTGRWPRSAMLGEKQYLALFAENRKKYEEKWGEAWKAEGVDVWSAPTSGFYQEQLEARARARRGEQGRRRLPALGRLGHPPLPAPAPPRARVRAARLRRDLRLQQRARPRRRLPRDRAEPLPLPRPAGAPRSRSRRRCSGPFPTTSTSADAYPPARATVYDWIDDLAVFPYDRALLDENHARGLAEATVVASVARRLHEQALAVAAGRPLLPNGVEYERFAAPPRRPARTELRALPRAGRAGRRLLRRARGVVRLRAPRRGRARAARLALPADRPAVRQEPARAAPAQARERPLARPARLRHAAGLPLALRRRDDPVPDQRDHAGDLAAEALRVLRGRQARRHDADAGVPGVSRRSRSPRTAAEFAAALDAARERGPGPRLPRAPARARPRELLVGARERSSRPSKGSRRPRRDLALAPPRPRPRAATAPAPGRRPALPRHVLARRHAATSAARRPRFYYTDPPLFRESLTCARCLTTTATARSRAASSRRPAELAGVERREPRGARRTRRRIGSSPSTTRRSPSTARATPTRSRTFSRAAPGSTSRPRRFEPRQKRGKRLGGRRDEPEPRGADVPRRVLRRRRDERRPGARAPGRARAPGDPPGAEAGRPPPLHRAALPRPPDGRPRRGRGSGGPVLATVT